MARYINVDLTEAEIADKIQKISANSDVFIAVRKILDEFPAEDVQEVKHGKWKQNKGDSAKRFYCTTCFEYGNTNYQYCPYCGAKMDGKENK